MKTPPYSLEEMYSILYRGIDALDDGSEYALKALTRMEIETPRWLQEHSKMQHTFPSPSNVMDCRLKLWFQGRTATCPLHGKQKHD